MSVCSMQNVSFLLQSFKVHALWYDILGIMIYANKIMH
jgi:hypothetical protein